MSATADPVAVNTRDKLADYRKRAEQEDPELLPELLAEVEYLTGLVTTVEAATMFYRFHAFDAIKDDQCPACLARVRIDESDPMRVRIISEDAIRRHGGTTPVPSWQR